MAHSAGLEAGTPPFPNHVVEKGVGEDGGMGLECPQLQITDYECFKESIYCDSFFCMVHNSIGLW